MNGIRAFSRSGVIVLLTLAAFAQVPQSTKAATENDTIRCKTALVLRIPAGYAETVISPNPIEAALALGSWSRPRAGETVTFADGTKSRWEKTEVDSTGWFSSDAFKKCYAYCEVELEEPRILLLEAFGDEMVYVNGTPRSGNPYGLADVINPWEDAYDYSRLPVQLPRGRSELLFRCGRERLKVRLCTPPKSVFFNAKDMTLPDIMTGQNTDTRGAVVLVNATSRPLHDLLIESRIGDAPSASLRVPIIQPYSVRKVAFPIVCPALSSTGTSNVEVEVYRDINSGKEVLDNVSIPLHVIGPLDNRKVTFVSEIDGSVQYYSILPSRDTSGWPQALFFSLHGASVEASGQSNAYYPKTWGNVVAPTNRRPYGFNWEEWGTLDAMEVLDLVQSTYPTDPNRVYLTGHSMGGHGTWHVGSLYPDRFAAIGPSAGWISFWTYRFKGMSIVDTSEVRAMIRRSTTPSETFMYAPNLNRLGVYVLHGSADDNVLVDQARMMVDTLKKFHKDFVYDEIQGQGHWWDLSDEPGADCVDWPPMFDFFARHSRPGKMRVREVHFRTSNPGVSSRCDWLLVDAQIHPLVMSMADMRFDPALRRFEGTTNNIARLAIDLEIVNPCDSIVVQLDGCHLLVRGWTQEQGQLWLERGNAGWLVSHAPSQDVKRHTRYGTFKDAFRNRMVFVFGTHGSREENKWAFEKARYDAEKFWYQGNGAVDVMADTEFDPTFHPERNVILYGNRRTNLAWKLLLGESPVQVDEGYVQFGDRKFKGDGISCLFVRPRLDDPEAMVAAISGTGIDGMKAANRIPYMSPGIGLPDCTILSSDVLTEGESGALMTGFFGLDWSMQTGEWAEGK
jgi:pimeloyl-ACP methyl ester carboxylesterase